MVGTLKQTLLAKGHKQVSVLMKTVPKCFIAKKNPILNRHLRNSHSEPSVQTSDCKEIDTDTRTKNIKRVERTAEITHQPSIGGPRNSTALCPTVTRFMSAVGLITGKIATRM